MELSCMPQRYDVDSAATTLRTTKLADESFDKNCCSPMTKTCNGFRGHPSLEKTAVLCLDKASFSLTKMPESYSGETNPLQNGSHCAALFNDRRNGFKPARSENGYLDYGRTTCNGFYDMMANDTRPEKTVGHGRPRCQNQPSRQRSCSEPASSVFGDELCHGMRNLMNPEQLRTSRLCVTTNASVDTRCLSFSAMETTNHKEVSENWLHGSPMPQVEPGLLQQTSRCRTAFGDVNPRRQYNGVIDQYQSHRLTHYRHRSFSDSKTETKLHSQERIPVARSENFVRQFEVENERKFQSNFRLNGRNPNTYREPEAALETKPNFHHAKMIFEMLRAKGPMASSDIATFVGPEAKRQVNPCLYYLHKEGLVNVSNGNPLLWDIGEQFHHECLSSPGVIGAERKNDKTYGRRIHCQEFSERQRRHSYNAYDNSPRKESRAVDYTRPRLRSNGHCSTPGERTSPYFCRLCKVPLSSEAQFEEHLQTTKHQNKVAKFNAVPYKKFCEFCKVHLNSESQAKEHFSSGRHEQTVAKSQKAPARQHFPLVAVAEELNLQYSTRTEPCLYQLELYSKAMQTNAVCFLPTGTGKTLVSALVIAHMLKLNPSRQVIFLVDRVLLVLQRSEYLRKELAHIRVADEGSSSSFNGTRPIRVGAVCGEMRKLEGNARIYEQDVLIITADCYRNHLNNGTLRFDDVSLIVLDEAHHCNKDHPYNVIIRDFYLREDALLGHRPKILGLTASPAGELSLDKTTKRMQRLLGNLGDAKLLVVTDSAQELEEKTRKAPPECITALYTQSEMDLKEFLMEYVTKVFNMAVRLSEMKDYKDIFQPSSGGLFSIDDIHPVLRVIDNILLSRPESNALNSLLHFRLICEAVCALQECGEKVALDQLAELTEERCPHGFHWAENMGLPCQTLWSYLEQYLRQGSWESEYYGAASGVEQLLQLLRRENWSGASGCTAGCVLVHVNRQSTAQYLASYLSNCRELLLRNVTTTWFGAPDKELVVLKQKEVPSQVRDGWSQIVVTSSPSEEGLDLPGCQLVLQMNPSGAVQALEQMRGRARFQDARFVIICRNDEQAKKIEDLLRREENMKRSVRIINGM